MNSIAKNWCDGMVPIVNGIIFADGRVYPVRAVDSPRNLPLTIEIAEHPTTFISDADHWTAALPAIEILESQIGLRVTVGECGAGGDGFIAITSEKNGAAPVWIAFFDFSNPFVAVYFDGETVVAKNNLNEMWRIPISGRGAIQVTKKEGSE